MLLWMPLKAVTEIQVKSTFKKSGSLIVTQKFQSREPELVNSDSAVSSGLQSCALPPMSIDVFWQLTSSACFPHVSAEAALFLPMCHLFNHQQKPFLEDSQQTPSRFIGQNCILYPCLNHPLARKREPPYGLDQP